MAARLSAKGLTQAVHDNLRNLGLDVLHVVNLRVMFGNTAPPKAPSGAVDRFGRTAAAGTDPAYRPQQRQPAQMAEGRKISEIVCVQNQYNIAQRDDEALIDNLAPRRHRLCAVFSTRRVHAAAIVDAIAIAARLGATPMQVALAWLLRRSPNILLIPGTSSVAHLRENLSAAELELPDEVLKTLDNVAA